MSEDESRHERKRKSRKHTHKKEKKSRRRSSSEPDSTRTKDTSAASAVPLTSSLVLNETVDVDLPTVSSTSTDPTPTTVVETSATVSTTPIVVPPLPTNTESSSNGDAKKDDEEEDDMKIDPWIPFDCSICKLSAKCYYRELRCSDGFYASPVFFMRDPFTPPPRVRGRKPVLNDYVVLGALCSICQQPACLAKSCTLYFGAHFCASCVSRERRRFPEKLVEIVAKAQTALAAQSDPAKAPLTEKPQKAK